MYSNEVERADIYGDFGVTKPFGLHGLHKIQRCKG